MKELTLEDFGLTPEEMKTIVSGAQRFLATTDEDGNPMDRTPETSVSAPDEKAPVNKEEDIQEWARWNTLTSSEEGWTGQNEPITGDKGGRTYLVRHGSTKLNSSDPEKDRIRGHQDIPLSTKGQKEAAKVADELSQFNIKVVYTPDLSRAEDTAKAIAEATGAKIEVDPDLRPWKFGPTIENHITADVLPKIKALVASPDQAPPGGESFNAFKERYLAAFHKLQGALNGKDAVLVGHYRTLKLLEAWRATGVNNDKVDSKVFNEHDPDTQPGDWEVIDRTGKLLDKPRQVTTS